MTLGLQKNLSVYTQNLHCGMDLDNKAVVVKTMSNNTFFKKYGYDYIYSQESRCGSIAINEKSPTHFLSFISKSNEFLINSGSYKLAFENEVTRCIPYNASALKLENILLELNSIRKVYVEAFENRKSSQFSFSYKIHFKGSPRFSTWPLLEILPKYFGRESCESFQGGENHQGVVAPLKDTRVCANGKSKMRVIVLTSETTFDGTFGIKLCG